jgi:hypothetical protein
MIDIIRYANISKIYTKKLQFYDENEIEKCRKFCCQYGITYLPSIDRKSYWELKDNNFIYKELTDIVCCSPSDLIFDLHTLEKFKDANSDNVLFVTNENKIVGVVHIVDYNQDEIYFEFYKLLFNFEKMIRELLKTKKVTDDTFLLYIKKKAEDKKNTQKSKEYWFYRYIEYVGDTEGKKIEKIKSRSILGPFQSYYLRDLLLFALHNKYLNSINVEVLTFLRNRIAHTNDIIKKDKTENEGHLYNFDGLHEFIQKSLLFFDYYLHLEEVLDCEKIKKPVISQN